MLKKDLNFKDTNGEKIVKNKILDHDISIVLQGPIYKDITQKVCSRMRDIFPNSEIILSTWKGSDVDGLEYDLLVLNEDPGGTPLMTDGSLNKTNNLNRMITSSKNGIKKASKKYTLRWRTDLLLKNSDFLNYFNLFDQRSDDWKIFKKRILVHNPTLPYIYPLGPTDISCFGLTEDVLIYWDLPLQTKEDAYYFINNQYPEERLLNIQNIAPKRGAEMYVWYNVLKKFESKYGKIKFDFSFDFNAEILRLSELSIVNNLQVLTRKQFDYEPLAHKYLGAASKTFITQGLWMYYYKKYCIKNIPFYDLNYYIFYPIKLFKYKYKYVIPFKSFLKNLLKLRLKSAYKHYNTYKKWYWRKN